MNEETDCKCSGCGANRPEAPGPCSNCGDTRRTFGVEINATAAVLPSISTIVRRGPVAWAYINMVVGILIAISLAVISTIDVIPWWARVVAMFCIPMMIIATFADTAKVHNGLMWVRRSYEDKDR
jgi:hypothetical protein